MTECRFIPYREMLIRLWEGWELIYLDNHHGAHSLLAVRQV